VREHGLRSSTLPLIDSVQTPSGRSWEFVTVQAARVLLIGMARASVCAKRASLLPQKPEELDPALGTHRGSLEPRRSLVAGPQRRSRRWPSQWKVNGWNGPPIKVVEVNGKMYVVDGHHRLAAGTQAGLKIPYEVVGPSTVIGPGQWSSVDDIVREHRMCANLRKPRWIAFGGRVVR
jgi:hypothetical protein